MTDMGDADSVHMNLWGHQNGVWMNNRGINDM